MLSSRIKWIDIAKAISIILIVFGHTMKGGMVRQIIYSFHVVSFIFLSGMTIKHEVPLTQIKKDFCKIMLPYYCFGSISIIIYLFLGNFVASKFQLDLSISAGQSFRGLLYASSQGSALKFNLPLWFLPCLFAIRTIYILLYRLFRGNFLTLYLIASAASIFSFWYTSDKWFYLPFCFELTLKLLPFFVLGTKFQTFYSILSSRIKSKSIICLCGILLIAIACILGYYFPCVNYHNNQFHNPLGFFITAFFGSVGISLASIGIDNCRYMEYLGRNTMGILVMHKFPILFFQTIGPFEKILCQYDSPIGLLCGGLPVSLLSIILCLLANIIVKKHFPFLLGLPYKKTLCQK